MYPKESALACNQNTCDQETQLNMIANRLNEEICRTDVIRTDLERKISAIYEWRQELQKESECDKGPNDYVSGMLQQLNRLSKINDNLGHILRHLNKVI